MPLFIERRDYRPETGLASTLYPTRSNRRASAKAAGLPAGTLDPAVDAAEPASYEVSLEHNGQAEEGEETNYVGDGRQDDARALGRVKA